MEALEQFSEKAAAVKCCKKDCSAKNWKTESW